MQEAREETGTDEACKTMMVTWIELRLDAAWELRHRGWQWGLTKRGPAKEIDQLGGRG